MFMLGSARKCRRRRTIWPAAALGALVLVLGIAPAARAETVSLGRLGVTNPKNTCTKCHYLQVASSAAAGYVVPPGEWTLSAWSGEGGEVDGLVRFDVYRPTGVAGQYQVLSQSEWETVPAATVSTFPASVPVRGGDVIGLATGPSGYPALIQTGDEADVNGSLIGTPAPGELVGSGTAREVNTSGQRELNVEATITRPDPLAIETPTLPAAASAPAASATSAGFTLGKQRHRHGSAIVRQTVTLTGPGTLTVAGKGLAPRRVVVSKAGAVDVAFAPRGGLLGSLTRHGKATGTARIVFTPSAGAPASRTEAVRFRLAR